MKYSESPSERIPMQTLYTCQRPYHLQWKTVYSISAMLLGPGRDRDPGLSTDRVFKVLYHELALLPRIVRT